MDCSLEELNKDFYSNQESASWYGNKNFLLPGEQVILAILESSVRDQPILDIGVGGGRTTGFLREISSDYCGVDFSPDMIETASANYPEAEFRVADARDLSQFEDGGFKLVLFSFNGIDCLSPAGRQQCMEEVRRVLQPGGHFCFSSHNREKKSPSPMDVSAFKSANGLGNLARLVAGQLSDCWSSFRNRSREEEHATYALRLDSGNRYRFPMYYTDKASEVLRLRELGYEDVSCFDGEGEKARPEESDSQSSWIYYLCRKPE